MSAPDRGRVPSAHVVHRRFTDDYEEAALVVRTLLPHATSPRSEPVGRLMVLRCSRCGNVPYRRLTALVPDGTGYRCRAEKACAARARDAMRDD